MKAKKAPPEWVFFIVCACFSLLFSQVIFSESLDTIARKICGAADKMKHAQIAVLPFPYHDGTEGPDSTIIAEKLVTKIVLRKKLQVVERALIEKVLAELKLQHSGAIDQETAKKIGNVLGVEALLTGTLIDLGDGHIEINARLINVESGLVLAAADEEIQRNWQEDLKSPKPADTAQNVQEKMSAFFHPREWKDPRFYSEDGTPRAGAAAGSDALVLSNAQDIPAESPAEEKIVEAPREWDPSNQDPRYAAWSRLHLAEAYFKQGRFQEAFREAKQSMKMTDLPRVRAQATYLMARSQEEMGKFGIAAGFYRDILQNHPYESRLIRQSGHRMRIHARKRP